MAQLHRFNLKCVLQPLQRNAVLPDPLEADSGVPVRRAVDVAVQKNQTLEALAIQVEALSYRQ